jgi:hypothetical protein
MNRRVVQPFIVGLFALFVAQAASAQERAPAVPAGPAPRITFDAKDVNLGDVVQGQDAVATFTYHNTGTAPLHILSAKPG